MKIYGNICCQDNMPDILRAIESMYPVCDEILVVDGGSKDGTLEFLKDRAEIYNLKVYKRKFDNLLNQRQFLLDKTPKNNWVVVLDPDEKFSWMFQFGFKYYMKKIKPVFYTDPKRNLPIVVSMNHFNLAKDIFHSDGEPVAHNQRVFYYDRDLKWFAPPNADPPEYHAHICYASQPDKDKGVVHIMTPIKGFSILHYARLDPKKLRLRKKRLGDKKYGAYDNKAWADEDITIVKLEKECL